MCSIPIYNAPMALDAVVMMRFPSDVKVALQAAAAAERRSMSNLALAVLSEWLAARGYLPGKVAPKAIPGRKGRKGSS